VSEKYRMYRKNELVIIECDTGQFYQILPSYCFNLFCVNLVDTLHKDVCIHALCPCAHTIMLGFSVVSRNLGKTQTVWTTTFARTRKCHNTYNMLTFPIRFYVLSKNCEKRLLAFSRLSVCLSAWKNAAPLDGFS